MKSKPSFFTKPILLAIVLSGLFLSGCADDSYAIEKKYWHLKRNAEKILRNPHATPPSELQKTVNAFNKFIQKYPKNRLSINADFTIATLYLTKGDYDAGRKQLEKIIEKYIAAKEIVTQAIFLTGNSYELENNWPNALEQYKRIMQSYPQTVKGLEMPIYIAQHYKVKYEPDKMNAAFQDAIAHYKIISARYPVTPLSYTIDMLSVQCYAELNDWQGAVNALNSVLKTYNGKVNLEGVLLSLASIYSQKLNNPAKAIEVLNVLVKEYPKSRYANLSKEIIKRLSAKKQVKE